MTTESAGASREAAAARLLVAINRALDQAEQLNGPMRAGDFRNFNAGLHHQIDSYVALVTLEDDNGDNGE